MFYGLRYDNHVHYTLNMLSDRKFLSEIISYYKLSEQIKKVSTP